MQNGGNQIGAGNFVADGVEVGARFSAFAIDGVAFGAGELFFIEEESFASGRVGLLGEGEAAVILKGMSCGRGNLRVGKK